MKARFRILASVALLTALWSAPSLGDNVYASRRERVRARIHGQAVLCSGNEATTGLDKSFYYLSGLPIPDAFLVLNSQTGLDTLFVDFSKTPLSPAEIVQTSGIASLYFYDQVGTALAAHLSYDPEVYFPMAYSPSDPAYIYLDCLEIEQLLGGFPYVLRRSLAPYLYPLRTVKDAGEIALLEQAVGISGAGALAGMAALKPGRYEYEIQRVIEDAFKSLGAPRTSFDTIVGSGPNSLILHYMENSRRMGAGEVVVMDVGAEYGRYAGDITRTAPVSGQFTPRQREVYEVVLEMQRRVFAACRPGVTLKDLDDVAKAHAVEKGFGAYFNFSGWRHSTSHSLGLDVHDPFYAVSLAAGMVITVEPGIYLPAENLGVRLEDDVLITAVGAVVLTADVPREAADIEAVMAGRYDPEAGTVSRRYGRPGRRAGLSIKRRP